MGLANLYLGCACALVLSSIALGVVRYLVHPLQSSLSGQIKQFGKKVQCLDCQKRRDPLTVTCEKCRVYPRGEDNSCRLTKARKETILKSIEPRLKQKNVPKETLENSHKQENSSKWSLSHLAKNVPRPTAHWILGSNVTAGEDIVISDWKYETGHGYAHSKNGIRNKAGEMTVSGSGWYLIYFQMVFIHPNVNTTSTQPRFEAVVQVRKDKSEHTDLLKSRETFRYGRHSRSIHESIRKERLFYLQGNEKLLLKESQAVNLHYGFTHDLANQNTPYPSFYSWLMRIRMSLVYLPRLCHGRSETTNEKEELCNEKLFVLLEAFVKLFT